ncbi:c-type cytochrome [Chryseolinea lacunae]|uniref:C-type cytochrome n=1 Tax=Chryseolinea lacunae TaxID=2801331 RepID=A0ABS1KSQ2_9BACT|nr:c-type cytochrome [Chryseolinea lacunae]MBL0742292.1 c-type cytochrome [Chryseolinea lacunae]
MKTVAKKILRILAWTFGILVVVVLAVGGYVKIFLPSVGPAPDLKVEATPARIERGRYLATNVMGCVGCHTLNDPSKKYARQTGAGGERWELPMGVFYSANITPTGVGDYTDGELYRALTCGVTKDGRALFPIMPYDLIGQCDPEDVKSLIAYMRTLAPAGEKWPEPDLKFPFNLVVNTIPARAQPKPKPSPEQEIAYGEYLVNAGVCTHCHTPRETDLPHDSVFLAGGNDFDLHNGKIVRSANITPHPTSGIGKWTKEYFISRFKACDSLSYEQIKAMNTVMPWSIFSGMTDQDLGAIYAYLRTLPPVNKPIQKYPEVNAIAGGN